MRDGQILLADRYLPEPATGADARDAGDAGRPGAPPVVLVRCPYGRRGLYGLMFGRLLAERGFTAVLQSTRGTFGSGGTFSPFREREDGADTVAWVTRQPWFTGVLGTAGISYLGLTQWALAADAGPALKACVITASASQFRDQTYPGGAFSLASGISWTNLVSRQEKRGAMLRLAAARGRVTSAFDTLPLSDLDRRLLGRSVEFWQEWLAHSNPGDPYWADRRFDGSLADVTAQVTLVGGWYDIFLPWQVEDYAALRAAGRHPRLVIGPWAHTDPGMTGTGLRETVTRLRSALIDAPSPAGGETGGRTGGNTGNTGGGTGGNTGNTGGGTGGNTGNTGGGTGGNTGGDTSPVRIHVTGGAGWRDLPDWPPPASETHWYLSDGGRLATEPPGVAEPDRYRYDPADPTPALSGPVLTPRTGGPVDNRQLEARPDVLVFTGPTLAADLDVIGPVRARLHVTASAGHADFFVRLCDVHPDGRSLNVCDGLLRIRPDEPDAATVDDDGIRPLVVELWPTGHRFARGHRIRVQVSGGAHPRFARNPGTAEPLGEATTLVASEQAVYHDADHPSAIVLPVVGSFG
jgi:hypothetical protein